MSPTRTTSADTLPPVNRRFRWEQPVGTFVLGMVSTLLAVAGILTHIQIFSTRSAT